MCNVAWMSVVHRCMNFAGPNIDSSKVVVGECLYLRIEIIILRFRRVMKNISFVQSKREAQRKNISLV